MANTDRDVLATMPETHPAKLWNCQAADHSLPTFGHGAGISRTPPSIQDVCSFLLRMLPLYETILRLSIIHYTTSAL